MREDTAGITFKLLPISPPFLSFLPSFTGGAILAMIFCESMTEIPCRFTFAFA